MGIPVYTTENTLQAKHLRHDIDAIVFIEPTEQRPSDVIHFPSSDDLSVSIKPSYVNPSAHVPEHSDHDEYIDLSGSFEPSHIMQNATSQTGTSETFANCGTYSEIGAVSSSSAVSGVFTHPNGTIVFYSKCQVVQTINI